MTQQFYSPPTCPPRDMEICVLFVNIQSISPMEKIQYWPVKEQTDKMWYTSVMEYDLVVKR